MIAAWVAMVAWGAPPGGLSATQQAGLRALVAEFEQDGVTSAPDDVERLHREACGAGWRPSCAPAAWRDGGAPSLGRLEAALAPVCGEEDPVACLAVGWSRSQVRPGVPDPGGTNPASARALFERFCELGVARACGEWGVLLKLGVGGPPDLAASLAALVRGCDGGSANSCAMVALSFRWGEGTAPDPVTAYRFAERACGGGDWLGCSLQGELTVHGEGTPPDAARGEALFESACAAGYGEACQILGARRAGQDDVAAARLSRRACDTGNVLGCVQAAKLAPPGEANALYERACEDGASCNALAVELAKSGGATPERIGAYYTRACELGEPWGCYNRAGQIAAEAPTEARALYRRGCDAGHGSSCNRLAIVIDQGDPDGAATAEVSTLYARACDLGEPWGCANLGTRVRDSAPDEAEQLYRRGCDGGLGVACNRLGLLIDERDPGRARDAEELGLYLRACDRGEPWGCHNAALDLSADDAEDADLERAAELLTRACDARLGSACNLLGERARDGRGIPADLERASELFGVACELDEPPGCANLAALATTEGNSLEVHIAASAEVFPAYRPGEGAYLTLRSRWFERSGGPRGRSEPRSLALYADRLYFSRVPTRSVLMVAYDDPGVRHEALPYRVAGAFEMWTAWPYFGPGGVDRAFDDPVATLPTFAGLGRADVEFPLSDFLRVRLSGGAVMADFEDLDGAVPGAEDGLGVSGAVSLVGTLEASGPVLMRGGQREIGVAGFASLADAPWDHVGVYLEDLRALPVGKQARVAIVTHLQGALRFGEVPPFLLHVIEPRLSPFTDAPSLLRGTPATWLAGQHLGRASLELRWNFAQYHGLPSEVDLFAAMFGEAALSASRWDQLTLDRVQRDAGAALMVAWRRRVDLRLDVTVVPRPDRAGVAVAPMLLLEQAGAWLP